MHRSLFQNQYPEGRRSCNDLGVIFGAGIVSSTSGIPWSHTGYHLDRLAFYVIADN
jgi:hypothetical protein